MVVLIFILLASCSLRESKNLNVVISKQMDSLIISNNLWETELIIRNKFLLTKEYFDYNPVYIIDSVKKNLYLLNPRIGILSIDLNTKETINEFTFSQNQRGEGKFMFNEVNDLLLFSSNARILCLKKDLSIYASYLDSVRFKYPKIGDKLVNFDLQLRDDMLNIELKYIQYDVKDNIQEIKDTIIKMKEPQISE